MKKEKKEETVKKLWVKKQQQQQKDQQNIDTTHSTMEIVSPLFMQQWLTVHLKTHFISNSGHHHHDSFLFVFVN